MVTELTKVTIKDYVLEGPWTENVLEITEDLLVEIMIEAHTTEVNMELTKHHSNIHMWKVISLIFITSDNENENDFTFHHLSKSWNPWMTIFLFCRDFGWKVANFSVILSEIAEIM